MLGASGNPHSMVSRRDLRPADGASITIDVVQTHGSLMDRMMAGFLIHDQKGIVYLNAAARGLLGPGAEVGAGLCALIDPETRPRWSPMRDAALAGDIGRLVAPVAHGGRQRYCEFTVGPFDWCGPRAVQVLTRDVSDMVEQNRELQWLALHDSLTGVSNRRAFFSVGDPQVVQARRYGRPLSVIMLDLDFFKTINDHFGHHAGDQVLREAARRCQEMLRRCDLFGRLGGEEFAAMLPETGVDGAALLADRLRQRIASQPVTYGGTTIPFTASFGVAVLGKDASLAELLTRADLALYAAKAGGRDRVVVAA